MGSLLRTNRGATSFADIQSGAAAGQTWAVDALADEFLPRLVSFASARGAADPDGIAHVSLLSVLRRLGDLQFEAKEQLWAYLCQTARSRIIDEFRATKPVDLIDSDATLNELGIDQPGHSPLSFDERIVERDYVDELLSPLTTEQRQVLEMRFFDDLSIEETATRTGRSQNAVKGLQRRAINAIIAAAAVILALIALRLVGGENETRRTINAPADTVVSEDVVSDQEEGAPNPVVVQEVEAEGQALPGTDDQSPTDSDTDPQLQANTPSLARFDVTRGSERSTELDTSGSTVSESAHGTRVYCTVSHFSHGDPISPSGAPNTAPATMFWGNSNAGPSSSGPELLSEGNGSCEGGVNDRSAYWMPAMFDEDDQVVLPEKVLVEYKSFGRPGFDRTTVQPIPAGLELLADSMGAGASGDDGSGTSVSISFPECISTDQAGAPVLSSPNGTTHLAEADASTSSGCPSSHPYRIPTLTYTLDFAVPFESDWSLSSGYSSRSSAGEPAAGFIGGMDQASMERLVTCTVELIDHCEFVGFTDGVRQGRSQLPERFVAPDGSVIYTGSVTLAPDADRTPFGQAVSRHS